MQCLRPECSRQRVEGSRWCERDRAFYDRVKATIDRERESELRKPIRGRTRICKWLDCSEPRKPGSEHCLHHTRLSEVL